MYKVLIVDDERWVAESIFQCIEWEKNAFEVIGIADSGQKAYHRIINDQPDIVLVDIRMPKMDGLELISKVNEAGLDVKFIVISGHADFSYAQKAMRENAIGYCLKPVNHVELLELLVKARDIICATQDYKHVRLFDLLFNYTPDLMEETGRLLHGVGLKFSDNEGVFALVSHGDVPVQFKNIRMCISSVFGCGKYVYLLQADDNEHFLKQPKQHILSTFKSIGIGRPALSADELKKSLDEAYLYSYQGFINSGEKIFSYLPPKNGDMDMLVSRINTCIKNQEVDNAVEIIHSIPEFLNVNHYSIKHAFYLFNCIMQGLSSSTDLLIEKYLFNYDQMTCMYSDVRAMAIAMADMARESRNKPPDGNVLIEKNTFCKILKYTTENFSHDISLSELSRRFYTNPSYISQLFKKELGQNFTDYVLSLRINLACELIANDNLSLMGISRNSGYDDYFYFSRVFKKKTGRTPSQYRDMLKTDRIK